MTYEQETLWLAGLLEGEGCFRARIHSVIVRLKMTDEDVVRKAAVLMGGKCKRLPHYGRPSHWKTSFEVNVCSEKAIQVMKRILPFMGQRRKAKIEELLERASHRMTPTEVAKNANRVRNKDKFSLSLYEEQMRGATDGR